MDNGIVGEIRLFAGNFPPYGWMFCDGSQVRIAQWPAVYAVLGTRYGGDGQTYFNVPDLRGNVAIDMGQGLGLSPYTLGQTGGETSYTPNLPAHNHNIMGVSSSATQANIVTNSSPNLPAVVSSRSPKYTNTSPTVNMTSNMLGSTGVPAVANVSNMQPTIAMNYVICLSGTFLPNPN